jgi:ABC-type multidrug transport system ATPase subunit
MTKPLTRDHAFIIGSARGAFFRIPHPSLAARHATLLWNGNETRVEDTSGGMGMKVNGQAQFAAVLADGDVIRLGEFEFTYRAAADPKPVNAELDFTVSLRGQNVSEIRLTSGLTFGNGPQADVRMNDQTLLPIHASLELGADGFTIVDKGGSGLLANGSFFECHLLLIGDRLDFGEEHTFSFDGWAIRRIPGEAGCALTAQHLGVKSGARSILNDAGFAAQAGEFVGIIGPSGAGKSTLLRALLGLVRTASGTVKLNQAEAAALPDAAGYFGYVPQKEIVHLELSGRQALRYAAALRLPARTPRNEIEKLINHLAARLGLTEHLDTRASQLSGGQLKRLSVAVELLSRPPVLLLDEPTSGLDPESETLLMRQLRELTATGCTVVCTTHLMENVHLMDSVEVVAAAPQQGEAGTTIFRGKPSAAREHFETRDFAGIYQRLREKKPSQWREIFLQRTKQEISAPQAPAEPSDPPPRPRHKHRAALPVLLRRQMDILLSDRKNVLLMLGQPLLIGALIAIAAAGTKDQSATKMFLAYIAAFWMACGNAAPELVRERAIFERERFAGLGIMAYLSSKFHSLGVIAIVQSMLLFGILKIAGVSGSVWWQILALGSTALAATGIGLLISAWARTVLQAVLLVPVLTIPQILFSGYVFKAQDWNQRPVPRILSRAFPGFAAQRIVDTSLLWGVRIVNYSDMDDAGLITSYENLCTALYPTSAWLHADASHKFAVDETQLYSEARGLPLARRELIWDAKSPPAFRLGAVYAWPTPALNGLIVLSLWAALSIGGTALLLRRQTD